MPPFAVFLDAIAPAFRDGDPAADSKAFENEHVRRVHAMYAAGTV